MELKLGKQAKTTAGVGVSWTTRSLARWLQNTVARHSIMVHFKVVDMLLKV